MRSALARSARAHVWPSPLIALEFLTPLRLRRVRQWDDRSFGAALAWYPLVGLAIGIVLLLLDRGLERLLPSGPASALLVAALVLLSGGLHLDGIADTADGLALQGDRAERLGIMSEGNTGPAGVMALVLVLLVTWTALASLAAPVRSAGIVLAPALARWAVVPVVVLFHPARPRGLGHALHAAAWPLAVPLATVLAAAAALALFGPQGLALLAVAAGAAVAIAYASARMLDGVTGDTYGAAIEIAQAALWLAIVAAGARGWLDATFLT
ncbi:MAG: adenosylcobinamide-GDP ribazoletransferase [Dehalococcoidia bacterium]|nr:adenosylcobinamide-GDP ribazoletransferase [Dehalococcoidia bacterium]